MIKCVLIARRRCTCACRVYKGMVLRKDACPMKLLGSFSRSIPLIELTLLHLRRMVVRSAFFNGVRHARQDTIPIAKYRTPRTAVIPPSTQTPAPDASDGIETSSGVVVLDSFVYHYPSASNDQVFDGRSSQLRDTGYGQPDVGQDGRSGSAFGIVISPTPHHCSLILD
ncbi:hypothetical protein OE88DRAFT_171792 [Heliocybe sulcata]|uniref:Uncharacterized protein n=1 Tax=Heliocybe sulcata TaxID=5364 RepID=A0A5C3MZH5_9AGAM|nr:hypothetical protein OE88DRAFT_171792 [Heliocybe sulcata]